MSALVKANAGEVVTAEQSKWIDRIKVYLQANLQSERQRAMYLYLLGVCLHQLKDSCEHGQFEKLKREVFPEEQTSRLGRAMQFSEAVDYLAKGQITYVGNLAESPKLLADVGFTEAEKSKLQAEVDKATHGNGVMKTIATWRKKTAPKPPPLDAVRAEQQHQLVVKESFEAATAALDWALHWGETDFPLWKAQRKELAGRCVRFGKRHRAIKPAKGGKL